MYHIQNKAHFYHLSRQLLLGNILRQWDWEEFQRLYLTRSKELPGIVGVRHRRAAFSSQGRSNLFPIVDAWQYALNTPDKDNLLFDEGARHDRLTIQGEVTATEHGLYVRYSHLQIHQRMLWQVARQGLKGLKPYQMPYNIDILTHTQRQGKCNRLIQHTWGIQAVLLLKHYMDGPSWESLNEILSYQRGVENTWGCPVLNFEYPIVEFACFDCGVGILGHNTLVWEVRSLE